MSFLKHMSSSMIWPVIVMVLLSVQQVASFDVGINSTTSDVLLEAKGSTLVVVADKVLRVYSLTGALLASFSDHTEPITSICVVRYF